MRNDRYATESEIKRELYADKFKVGGPVLYHSKGSNYVYGGEGHCMYLGVSGAGKTRRGTLPLVRSIINAGESAVAVDAKGDLYFETSEYAREKGYDVRIVNMRDIFTSARYNPLWLPYQLYKSGDIRKKHTSELMINELAENLYPENLKDPFWNDSARSVFKGAVISLFECGREDEINMSSVYSIIVNGDIRFADGTYLKQFTEYLDSSLPKIDLCSYITTANETRGGIRSNFLQGISIFSKSEGIVNFCSMDDLFIEDLDGSKKVLIYIILPDETGVFNKQCGVLVSQLMTHFVRIAHEKHRGRLPVRLNIVLEELFSIGSAISNLPQMLSSFRSRNIRVQYVLQSLSQLNDVYGESNAKTIIGNTDVIVAYRTNDWDTLTYLSNMCGNRTVERGGTLVAEALVTPSQLAAMRTGQALVMVSGRLRFVTGLPDYEEMYDCSDRKEPKEFEDTAVCKTNVFDIVEYVKEKKREQMLKKLEEPPIRNISNTPPIVPTGFGSFLEERMAEIDDMIRALDEREAKKRKGKAAPKKEE